MKYTFSRTVEYTETIEVLADSYEEAKSLALQVEDAEHNNDDAIVAVTFLKKED